MNSDAYDQFASALLVVDDDNSIVDCNAQFEQWTGRTRAQLRGMPFDELVGAPSRAISADDEYLPAVAEITRADGSILAVLVSASEPTNGMRHIVLFDATEQRAFRKRLQAKHTLGQRTQTRLELIIASSILFSETNSELELAEALVQTTARAYAAEEAVVFLAGADGAFEYAAGINPFTDIGDSEALAARALQLRSVLKISGVAEAYAVAPAVGEAFERAGVQSMIIAPIHDGDRAIGILAAFFHHPRQFDDEAAPLADALAGQAARAITALRLQERLEHAATHDDTTGLPNRRLLEERLDGVRHGDDATVAVLFVDLDGFKSVNDLSGHQVGDAILREVGVRLLDSVRADDTVARYGGDEFVIVCDVKDEDAALDLAERVRERLSAPYNVLPHTVRIAASVGVTVSRGNAATGGIEQLVREADQAMYRAKYAGGDRVASSGK